MLDYHRTHRQRKQAPVLARRPLLPVAGMSCPYCKGETIPSGREGKPCENCFYCPRCAMILTNGDAERKCRSCSFLLRASQPLGADGGGA